MATELKGGSDPIALDAERASGHRYGQKAYLIQLRAANVGTALIDPVSIEDFSALADAMAGREWILHAASQDLPCLAELGLRPDALFDSELAGRILGLPKVGLAALTEELLGVQLAKGHAASDWSRRPLPHPWLVYAALDVELLHELRNELIDRLETADRVRWAQEEFESLLELQPRTIAEPWRRTSGLHKVGKPRGRAVVRSMWTARDQVARDLDRAPGRVLPDSAILAAAKQLPKSKSDLKRLPEFRRASRAGVWWGAVEDAMALPENELPGRPELTGPPPPRSWDRRNPDAATRLKRAREQVKSVADELGVGAEIVVSPAMVRAVAWSPPETVDEANVGRALETEGARAWQIEIVAGPITRGMLSGPAAVLAPQEIAES